MTNHPAPADSGTNTITNVASLAQRHARRPHAPLSTQRDPFGSSTQWAVEAADCRVGLARLADNSVDAVVTDPPYEVNYGRAAWDRTGIAFDTEVWREVLRVLKPGGHLIAFGATRTYHRLAAAVEDAGFAVCDMLHWGYSQGAPTGSVSVGKAIDKELGADRPVVGSGGRPRASGRLDGDLRSFLRPTWDITAPATPEAARFEGFGTKLKPAHEPAVLARKPLDGRVGGNALRWGTGGLNIDGCRVSDGRWPANAMLDEGAAELLGDRSKFFYVAKPSRRERDRGLDGRNPHITVKPVALMRELCRLVGGHPGSIVLDPFAGSGTTGMAAIEEGFRFLGFELDAEHAEVARKRIATAGGPAAHDRLSA